MRVALAAVLAIAALWTAGCLGAPGETITMRDGLGDARDAAADWGDHPRLAGAAAIEPFKRIVHEEDGAVRGEFVTHLDGKPGDGRAPGWLYVFVADDGRCVFVALAAGLGVLAEGWEDCGDGEAMEALPPGVLDSDDVADLLGKQAGWPEPSEDTSLTWTLSVEDGNAMWLVVTSNQTATVIAVVDAVDGNVTLLDNEAWFGGGFAAGDAGMGTEGTQAMGSAAAVTPLTPLVVELELGDGAQLSVTGSASTSITGLADLVVVGPSGELFRDDIRGSASVEMWGLPGGTYEIRIEHDNVALTPAISASAFWST